MALLAGGLKKGIRVKRTIRNRRLTPEEAAGYNALRKQIEREKPEINRRIRQRMAQRRREAARRSGETTFGERIRAAREVRGQLPAETAAAVGIAESYLIEIERDEREPSLSVALLLARTLGVSLDELPAPAP